MKLEITLKEQRKHTLDKSYMWFYILMTIYCVILSLFIFGNQGESNQLKVLFFGFAVPFALLMIGDFISKINIKRIK